MATSSWGASWGASWGTAWNREVVVSGDDPTDAKFQRPSHNTLIRWQRKEKTPVEDPAAAAVPALGAAPVPKREPRSTGIGTIAVPPTPAAPEPQIEVLSPKVVRLPMRAAAPAPVEPPAAPEAPAPTASPALSETDVQRAVGAAVEQVVATFEGAMTGLTREVVRLQKHVLTMSEQHAAQTAKLAEMLRAAEKREVNRARAEALARKIAEDQNS